MKSLRTIILLGVLILVWLIATIWPTFRNLGASQGSPSSNSDLTQNPEQPPTAATPTKRRLLPLSNGATLESKEPSSDVVKEILRAYSAEISFYGKVVDEGGVPVRGAMVNMTANDKPLGNSIVYQQVSDSEGLFLLRDAKGAALSVNVAKEGYYSTAASKGRFVYGGVRGDDDPPNPTLSRPAVFVLKKMGETASLIAVDRDVVVPKNGQPVEISLHTGRQANAGQGDIVVECWTDNEGIDPNKNDRFDWRMRLTIQGGGLVERDGEFAFIAPADGYRPGIEIDMPRDAQNWRSTFQGEYFVKTRSGSFARVNFRMTAAGSHFITIKAQLNPVPRDQNLEFDPVKAIVP